MKKTSYLNMIIFGLCAIIWIIRVILDIVYQTYSNSVFGFILNILCAVVWSAAFILEFKRYRSNKKE